MNTDTMNISANQVFEWRKGLAIKANERIFVTFPAAVLDGDVSIGEVIELSDEESQIAFYESPSNPGVRTHIVVELRKGAILRLHRNTEALIKGNKGKKLDLEVLS